MFIWNILTVCNPWLYRFDVLFSQTFFSQDFGTRCRCNKRVRYSYKSVKRHYKYVLWYDQGCWITYTLMKDNNENESRRWYYYCCLSWLYRGIVVGILVYMKTVYVCDVWYGFHVCTTLNRICVLWISHEQFYLSVGRMAGLFFFC
jgi:hypothetical protein